MEALTQTCSVCGKTYNLKDGHPLLDCCKELKRQVEELKADVRLADIIDECLEVAKAKGWNNPPPTIVEQIALLHSEASEALESYRNDEPLSWTDENGKPQGIASEYADTCIRCFHYVKLLGINLPAEIRRKLDYNKVRPYRHGDKKC